MAGYNPFRRFQKNQKFWLAVLGVGTMISFIILPVLMQLFSGTSGPVVEEFGRSRRFGVVNEQTLGALSANRQQLEGFYKVLYERLADPGDETRMNALNYLGSLAGQFEQRISQEELVNNWLLAQYARSQGLVVDQTDVIGFLTRATSGYLSDTIFKEVLRSVGLTEKRLEYLISQEMLASQIRQSFEVSMGAITPATRWDWFQRMNRQVTAEVASVPVDRFLDKVAQPTDAQLRQLFDKYKDKPYNPTSSESGFVIPDKIAFQYVLATPSKEMLDSVTDAEIKKYYDANKGEKFLKPVRPIGERPGLNDLPGQGGLFPGLGGFTQPQGTPRSTPFPTPMSRPVTPAPTAPVATPATTPTEVKPEEKPAEKPAETPKSEEPKAELKEESKADAEKTSAVTPSVRTRFVSYQTETEAKPAADAKPEPKAEEKKEEPKPAEKPEVKPEAKKDEQPIDLEILYRPLEEVKGEIRETLARQKALDAMEKLKDKMSDYSKTFYLYADLNDANATPPAAPDFGAMAKELGLELVAVERDTFFGAVKSEFARGMQERQHLFQMFTEKPPVYVPQNFDGSNGPYLYWITELVDELRPKKMEEVRDLVVQRWKEIEARTMAMKQAEELAAEAKTSGKSLAETFASKTDVPVVETEAFTWKTYGPGVSPWMAIMNRIPPRTGEVCEKGVSVGDAEIDNKWIFAPGNRFMEAAYSLAVGETGATFNEPKTVAYVVRITGSTPSEDVLWERFQSSHLMEYYLAGQPEIIMEARDAWMKQIYRETGFEWIKNPDEFYGRR